MDAYLISLAKDYVDLVSSMLAGGYSAAETYELESQRLIIHEELCKLLDVSRRSDMYRIARNLLHQARAQGASYD